MDLVDAGCHRLPFSQPVRAFEDPGLELKQLPGIGQHLGNPWRKLSPGQRDTADEEERPAAKVKPKAKKQLAKKRPVKRTLAASLR